MAASGRYQWTDEATEALLSLWKKKEQNQRWLDYDTITSSMNSMGFMVSKKHCRSRIKNLMYRYKKASYKARLHGTEIEHKHFRRMETILGQADDTLPDHHSQDKKNEEVDDDDEEEEIAMEEGAALSSLPHVVFITHETPELPPEETSSEEALTRNNQHLTPPGLSVAGEGHQEFPPGSLDPGGAPGKFHENVCVRRSDDGENAGEGLREDLGQTRTLTDSNILEVIKLMRTEAEDREDARQQRLLAHEARMEEKRQQCRQVELRHQEMLAHMVLRGMERLGELIVFTQQQKSSENFKESPMVSGDGGREGDLDQSEKQRDSPGEQSDTTEGYHRRGNVGTTEGVLVLEEEVISEE